MVKFPPIQIDDIKISVTRDGISSKKVTISSPGWDGMKELIVYTKQNGWFRILLEGETSPLTVYTTYFDVSPPNDRVKTFKFDKEALETSAKEFGLTVDQLETAVLVYLFGSALGQDTPIEE